MPWGRITLAVLASGVVSSLTDWLFMGDWLYKRFDRHPEIWRYRGGQGESRAILWSSLLPFLTCGVFVLVCSRLHLFLYRETFKLALAIWLIQTGKNALGQNSLAIASKATGGLHLNTMRDRTIEKALDSIGGEIHAQYTLGYRPPGDEPSGFHDIKVVVDRPGVTVRSRPGYYLPPPDSD